MVPATNKHALYSQLSQIKINSFTRDSLKSVNHNVWVSVTNKGSSSSLYRLTELLGAGQFGKVHQGEWTALGSEDKVDVAVKTLKEGAGEEDKVKFLQEAAIMGQFSHPNVVKLYGVVTEREPVSFCFSFARYLVGVVSKDNFIPTGNAGYRTPSQRRSQRTVM